MFGLEKSVSSLFLQVYVNETRNVLTALLNRLQIPKTRVSGSGSEIEYLSFCLSICIQ